MGGRRLTPGQAVDALSEAIDIIRGIWDQGERSRFEVDGTYYRVSGAKRGPAPAHNIPILIGAYKPRMLRLTGRKADGWVPSLAYMKPGEFAEKNDIIDEAATAAGRDPREIRRIVNIGGRFSSGAAAADSSTGPPSSGSSNCCRTSSTTASARSCSRATTPARSSTSPKRSRPRCARRSRPSCANGRIGCLARRIRRTRSRSTAVRAKRRDGIDYDALPDALAAKAIEPGDAGYARVKSTYMRGGAPGPRAAAGHRRRGRRGARVRAREPDVPLGVRSGGHGISGRSTNDGGIVIDLSRMRDMRVLDEARRLVRIEAGARWQDVAAFLAPHGWALSSGDYGGVGVGGLATAGGVGWLVREHGLTIDHVRAVEVVLADGSIVRADASNHADLFWAVRGAGANFGIVTAFEFEVDEVGAVGFAQLSFDASDTAGFLQAWGDWVVEAPRDLTSFVIMSAGRPGQPPTAHVMAMVDSDDPDTVLARLQPLAEAAPLVGQDVRITSYQAVITNAGDASHGAEGEPTARSGLIGRITPSFAADAARFLESGATYFFQLRAVGGAVHDVPADATAFAHRSAEFSVVAFGSNRRHANDRWNEFIAPHTSGAYLSFETEQGDEQVEAAFPPATLARLRELKRRFDPDNVFRDNANITPA